MLANPDQRGKLNAMGMTPLPQNAQQLAASLATDRKRFETLVKKSGYQPETS
jgi:type VI protein secretion system component VasF